jgi:hypothetical protein
LSPRSFIYLFLILLVITRRLASRDKTISISSPKQEKVPKGTSRYSCYYLALIVFLFPWIMIVANRYGSESIELLFKVHQRFWACSPRNEGPRASLRDGIRGTFWEGEGLVWQGLVTSCDCLCPVLRLSCLVSSCSVLPCLHPIYMLRFFIVLTCGLVCWFPVVLPWLFLQISHVERSAGLSPSTIKKMRQLVRSKHALCCFMIILSCVVLSNGWSLAIVLSAKILFHQSGIKWCMSMISMRCLIGLLVLFLVFLHLSRLPCLSLSRDRLESSSRVEFATSFDAVEKELREKLGGKKSKCCVSWASSFLFIHFWTIFWMVKYFYDSCTSA